MRSERFRACEPRAAKVTTTRRVFLGATAGSLALDAAMLKGDRKGMNQNRDANKGNEIVLIAGESWTSYGVHVKGFSNYYTGAYEEGAGALTQALESSGLQVEYLPNHLAGTKFPASSQELSRFAAVLLSDISSDTLLLHPNTLNKSIRTPNRLRALAEYVQGGGGLAMIGGWMSFAGFSGQARYHSTPIEEILPVSISPFDDRVETPEGVVPQVASDHEILRGISGKWPYFLGYNRLKAKPEGVVLLSCQGDPFLVVSERGRGRTAAFASDCAPHWGPPEFLGWEHYSRFWTQLVRWLARGNSATRS